MNNSTLKFWSWCTVRQYDKKGSIFTQDLDFSYHYQGNQGNVRKIQGTHWNWQAFGYDVRLTIAQKCVFSKPFMSLCKQPLTCQRLCGMRSLKIVFAIKSDYRCWHKHTLHKSNAICPEWVRLRIQEIINGQVWVAPTLLCKSAVFANIATSSCG